ncbi:FAD-dependent oxidoreductase [Thalassiella azotivora]
MSPTTGTPLLRPLWDLPQPAGGPPGEDVDCDVAVVGAGVVGLTAAVVLAEAGLGVRVLEARQVGAGTTGGSTAKVTLAQGTRFSELCDRHGVDAVLHYAQANLDGQRWLGERARSAGHPAQVRDAVSYATTATGRRALEQEAAAMSAAGVVPDVVDDPGLPWPTTGALVLPGQLQVDPGRHLAGLRAQAEVAGAVVHEGTTVSVLATSDGASLRCVRTADGSAAGTVRARWVIVASGMPFPDRAAFFARQEPVRSYCVAVRVRGPHPQAMLLSVDQPTRSVRTAGDGVVVVGGNGHVVGRATDTDQRLDDLEAFARDHLDVTAVTHRWAAQDHRTADGLPFVGRLLPWQGSVLVATGFAKWGMAAGTAAGLGLAGTVLGEPPAWSASWDPWRPTGLRQLPRLASFNAGVGLRLAQGWAETVLGAVRHAVGDQADDGAAPAEGEGRVRLAGAQPPVAESCVDGVVHRVGAVCPHLGGVVRWNPGERTWDCPLHGSRFAADGSRLEGPATRGLAPRD